jgi:hypothetical protein
MKKHVYTLASCIFLAFVIISCKKNNDQPKDPVPTVQNVSGSYTIAKITLKDNTTSQEQVQTYPDCKKDDELRFNLDMSFNYVDAGVICQTPGDWSGVWALTNSTTLSIDGSPSTIIKFDGTNLDLSSVYDDTHSLITYLVRAQ